MFTTKISSLDAEISEISDVASANIHGGVKRAGVDYPLYKGKDVCWYSRAFAKGPGPFFKRGCLICRKAIVERDYPG
jgi:hypothetical protein